VVLVVEVLLVQADLEEQEQTTQGPLNKVILAEMALVEVVAVVVVPAAVGHLGQAPIVVDLVDLVFKFQQHLEIQQLLQVTRQIHYHIKEVVV
jgi:hypothetical protein